MMIALLRSFTYDITGVVHAKKKTVCSSLSLSLKCCYVKKARCFSKRIATKIVRRNISTKHHAIFTRVHPRNILTSHDINWPLPNQRSNCDNITFPIINMYLHTQIMSETTSRHLLLYGLPL